MDFLDYLIALLPTMLFFWADCPCCGSASCSNCAGSPQCWEIVVPTMTNTFCSFCTTVDGTHELVNDVDCRWTSADLPSCDTDGAGTCLGSGPSGAYWRIEQPTERLRYVDRSAVVAVHYDCDSSVCDNAAITFTKGADYGCCPWPTSITATPVTCS